MGQKTGESPVQRACLDLLQSRRNQVEAWRNNTTGVYDPVKKRFRAFTSRKGVSDILGIIVGSGRFFAVETKRPAIPEIGQRAGVLTEDQRLFLEMVNWSGGVGVCVRDVRVLISVLDELRDCPSMRFDIEGRL